MAIDTMKHSPKSSLLSIVAFLFFAISLHIPAVAHADELDPSEEAPRPTSPRSPDSAASGYEGGRDLGAEHVSAALDAMDPEGVPSRTQTTTPPLSSDALAQRAEAAEERARREEPARGEQQQSVWQPLLGLLRGASSIGALPTHSHLIEAAPRKG